MLVRISALLLDTFTARKINSYTIIDSLFVSREFWSAFRFEIIPGKAPEHG